MGLIELKNINKVYGKNESEINALKNINLTIETGDFIAIMGRSGSGKSTLLNILGLLDKASDGEYLFNGVSINNYSKKEIALLRNKDFGFIVQYFALVDDYTVEENIRIPLDYSKKTRKEKKSRINEVLKQLQIEDKEKKYPKELSGGQCQRVAIARALVNNPSIILADEPTGALDTVTADIVMDILKELNDNGKTIIIVTHDKNVAEKCKKILYVENGEFV